MLLLGKGNVLQRIYPNGSRLSIILKLVRVHDCDFNTDLIIIDIKSNKENSGP